MFNVWWCAVCIFVYKWHSAWPEILNMTQNQRQLYQSLAIDIFTVSCGVNYRDARLFEFCCACHRRWRRCVALLYVPNQWTHTCVEIIVAWIQYRSLIWWTKCDICTRSHFCWVNVRTFERFRKVFAVCRCRVSAQAITSVMENFHTSEVRHWTRRISVFANRTQALHCSNHQWIRATH